VDAGWLERFVAAWQRHAQAGGPEGAEDARRLLAFLADDATWEDVAVGVVYRGRAELQTMFEQSHQWAPDLVFDVRRAAGGAGHYLIEWEMHAERTGGFGDMAASDRPFRVRGVSVGEVGADGRVTRHSDYWDRLGWMDQVGITPDGAS
jgi:steroid delta-isomerase-like uncharacterized protein